MSSSTSPPSSPSPLRIPRPPSPEQAQLRHALLRDLSQQAFQAWRHHPVSRLVLLYLADYRDRLDLLALEAFRGGALVALQEGEMRGRVLTLDELVRLEWPSVCEFYDFVAAEPEEKS